MLYVKIYDIGIQVVRHLHKHPRQGCISPSEEPPPTLAPCDKTTLGRKPCPFIRMVVGHRSEQGASQPIHIDPHEDLATKQGRPHEATTPITCSSIVHLNIRNTPKQTRRSRKPQADADK
jgi:hypothetical protein